MSTQPSADQDIPKVGQSCRIWHGPGFTRSGRIIGVDAYNKQILVEYDYDLPNEWVSWSKQC